jgi:hypothetical protein
MDMDPFALDAFLESIGYASGCLTAAAVRAEDVLSWHGSFCSDFSKITQCAVRVRMQDCQYS